MLGIKGNHLKVELYPECGWEHYQDSDVVQQIVFEQLKLREHGGNWSYLNFTSCSSVWEFDGNLVSVSFSALESIESLVIQCRNGSDLNQLIKCLNKKLGLLCRYS